MSESKIPEGFKLFGKDDSFNDAIAPLYLSVDDKRPCIGLLLEKHHCNYVGFCHGGVIMTLIDIALSSAVCCELGKYTSTPTVSINFDFIAGAKQGDWIYADVQSVNLTRSMGFASAMIIGEKGTVATASGCYKLPADLQSAPGMSVEDYHLWRFSNA